MLKSVNADITKLIEEKVDEEKVKWAEETAKELTKGRYSLGRVQDYVSTATKKSFKAAQVSSEKRWATLFNVFSEAPGSPQSADRIKSAVTGAGYILQPVVGEKQDLKEYATLTEFFNKPNEDTSISSIVQNIVTNYYAFGNSYIEIVYEDTEGDERGDVVGMYTLPSEDIKILVDAEKRKAGVNIPIGYEMYVPFVEEKEKSIIYEMDEIMHFRRPNPRGGLYGRALFEDNQAVTQLILQSLTYNIKTFENSGKPPLKIRLPEGSSSTEALEFSNFFEKNFQGMHNAGKALILYNNANAEALGLTPSDIEYLKLLNFGVKQVASMYGVPLVMLSQPEGSNRATSYEEIKSFYQRVSQPLRNAICEKITQDIIVDGFGIKSWKLDFKDVDLEDSTARVEEASKSFMYGTRSWNEARKRMNLEVGTEPWMDEFFVIHNGIATPLKDFANGKAKSQTDRQDDKEKKSISKKAETVAEAKKKAKKENAEINKGEIPDADRSDNHKTHLAEHKKVLYTTKEKYRASLRVHMYAHEDLMYWQDEDGNYGYVHKEEDKKKNKK